MTIKRFIVDKLEVMCDFVDRLWYWPFPFTLIARWFGCPSGLALWSSKLDDRWNTSVWSNTPREEL